MSKTFREFNLLKLIDILRTIKDETNQIQHIERMIHKHCDYEIITASGDSVFKRKGRVRYYLVHSDKNNRIFEENRYIIANGLVHTYLPGALHSKNFNDIDKIHQTLMDPYSDSNISITAVPNPTVSNSENVRKLLNIKELNWMIFQFLDLKSLLNYRSVNQRLLYDGYDAGCIYNIDLYQISQYMYYLRRGRKWNYINDPLRTHEYFEYRIIKHVLPIDNCQCVTINVNDIEGDEWPQIAKQNNDWKLINDHGLDGGKINVNFKYLKIEMDLKRQIVVRGGKFQWLPLTAWNDVDKGKEWLIKWTNDCCHDLKRITLILYNGNMMLYSISHSENIKDFHDSLKQYEKFFNVMNHQLCKKDCNNMRFKIVDPLSVFIEGSQSNKWRHTSLDVSKSTWMVNVVRLLHKWYENGNINVELVFKVTHGKEDLNSFDIKKEQWMQLIFKIIKQESFFIDKNDNCDVWHFLQSGQLSNTMILNDRMKITYEVSNSRESVRNDYKRLSILLSIFLDWQSDSFKTS